MEHHSERPMELETAHQTERPMELETAHQTEMQRGWKIPREMLMEPHWERPMEHLQPLSIPVPTNLRHCRQHQVRNHPDYIDGLEAKLQSIPRSQIGYKPYRLARSMYTWDHMAGDHLEELELELELEELDLEEVDLLDFELELQLLELQLLDLELESQCMGLPLSRPMSMLQYEYRHHFDQV